MGTSRDSVIVVGNGSSLLGSNLGASIDSFDKVVRFNLFTLRGFEQDVGKRTSFWFSNRGPDNPAVTGRLSREGPFERIYVHTWGATQAAAKAFETELLRMGAATPVHPVDQRVLAEMSALFPVKYSMFSTGAIGVYLMLQEFPEVTLAGFDWWEPGKKFHYNDNVKFVYRPNGGHQPQLELDFFERFAAQGRLKFLRTPT